MSCRQLRNLLNHRGMRVIMNRPDPQGDKDHRKERQQGGGSHGLAGVGDKDLGGNAMLGYTVAVAGGAIG